MMRRAEMGAPPPPLAVSPLRSCCSASSRMATGTPRTAASGTSLPCMAPAAYRHCRSARQSKAEKPSAASRGYEGLVDI